MISTGRDIISTMSILRGYITHMPGTPSPTFDNIFDIFATGFILLDRTHSINAHTHLYIVLKCIVELNKFLRHNVQPIVILTPADEFVFKHQEVGVGLVHHYTVVVGVGNQTGDFGIARLKSGLDGRRDGRLVLVVIAETFENVLQSVVDFNDVVCTGVRLSGGNELSAHPEVLRYVHF